MVGGPDTTDYKGSMIHFYLMGRALAVLLFLSPIGKPHEALPGWTETDDARLHRYYAIAADVAVVADEACKGNRACAVNAVHALLGVAWHESGFAPDVDVGPCYRGLDGKGPRCDGGNAYSMWQLHPLGCAQGPHAGPCAEVADYADRRKAAREALRRMARSIRECRKASVPRDEELAVYAGGGCKLPSAMRAARDLAAAIKRATRAPDLPAPGPASPPAPPVKVDPSVLAEAR